MQSKTKYVLAQCTYRNKNKNVFLGFIGNYIFRKCIFPEKGMPAGCEEI